MKRIIFSTLFYLGFSTLYAQEKAPIRQAFPINITIMHESISLPFVANPVQYSYNPAVVIGSEYLLKQNQKADYFLSGNLGYYFHKSWESTLFTEVKIAYKRNFGRFGISPNIGIGYAHIFSTKPIYAYENNIFQKVADHGKPAFQSSISLVPSFKLFEKNNSPEINITYTFTFQYPFSETNGFHQFIGVGFKFYPFKNK